MNNIPVEMLNELEAAVQDYNDLLDSVLCVQNDNLRGEFFCLKNHKWKPMLDLERKLLLTLRFRSWNNVK